ncbi:histidine kinase response regulator : Response regulator with-like receiver domain protein and winged-helix dna-binding domain protein OS=Leptolyngbya sp. Heron Island J GN=N836_10960 PE=4 SV=1: Response_reg [Gemmata massiliana]|uniref:Response regulatory domain-containing protein n=1 Tax=Gemmata massiliana TaxID=1210884 RepID=A0A6P2CW79_9BACT|nr:response regulator [Gemmata massiliana]VTR91974.1 histidine kinase response regulator : Response regulator with-like receiver domain protein and winged-helix dna-binding domain protein OS=Leptolyngbya sp. Heron Island J GN=N836_10960 PE=4 SV=1: Response_reg [Gemmata massiliana]
MSSPDRSTPTVLVVDDEPAITQLLALALTRAGFIVRAVNGGARAFDEYQSGDIDLVVIDVQMPRPWDGPRTLAALRAIDPDVRAVFMSGNTGEYTHEELLARGALRVLTKPFPRLSQLAEELRALVPGAEPPAEPGGES